MKSWTNPLFDTIFQQLSEQLLSETEDVLLSNLRKSGQDCYLREDLRFKKTSGDRWIVRSSHLINDDLYNILNGNDESLSLLHLRKCPKCQYIGTENGMFGFRQVKSGAGRKTIIQSHCSVCRGKGRARCSLPTIDVQSVSCLNNKSFCPSDERFKFFHKKKYLTLNKEPEKLPKGAFQFVEPLFQYTSFIPIFSTQEILSRGIQSNSDIIPLGWFPLDSIDGTLEDVYSCFVGKYERGWAVFQFNEQASSGFYLTLEDEKIIVLEKETGLIKWIQDVKLRSKRSRKEGGKSLVPTWKRFFETEANGSRGPFTDTDILLEPICEAIEKDGDIIQSFGFELKSKHLAYNPQIRPFVLTGLINCWGVQSEEGVCYSHESAKDCLFDNQIVFCSPSDGDFSLIWKAPSDVQQSMLDEVLPSILSSKAVCKGLNKESVNCFKVDNIGVGRLIGGTQLHLHEVYRFLVPPEIPFDVQVEFIKYPNQWKLFELCITEKEAKVLETLGFTTVKATPKVQIFEKPPNDYKTISNGDIIPVFSKGNGKLRCFGFEVNEENSFWVELSDGKQQFQYDLSRGEEWLIELEDLPVGRFVLSVVPQSTEILSAYFCFEIADDVIIEPPLSTVTYWGEEPEKGPIDFYDEETERVRFSKLLMSKPFGEKEEVHLARICGPAHWPIQFVLQTSTKIFKRRLALDSKGELYFETYRELLTKFKEDDGIVIISAAELGRIILRQHQQLNLITMTQWKKYVLELRQVLPLCQSVQDIARKFLTPLFSNIGFLRLDFVNVHKEEPVNIQVYHLKDIPWYKSESMLIEIVGIVLFLEDEIKEEYWAHIQKKLSGFEGDLLNKSLKVFVMDTRRISNVTVDNHLQPYQYRKFIDIDSQDFWELAQWNRGFINA